MTKKADETRRISHADWIKEGREKFGDDISKWLFKCPSCGIVTAAEEWLAADAKDMVAFSCIGRTKESAGELGSSPGPCNYAGGGLFNLNPVQVVIEGSKARPTFEFADKPGVDHGG